MIILLILFIAELGAGIGGYVLRNKVMFVMNNFEFAKFLLFLHNNALYI